MFLRGTGASAQPLPLAGTLEGRRPRCAPPSSPRAVLPDSLRAGSSGTEFGDSLTATDSPGSVCPPAPARPPDCSSDVPRLGGRAADSADPAGPSVSRIPSAPASSLLVVARSEGPHLPRCRPAERLEGLNQSARSGATADDRDG